MKADLALAANLDNLSVVLGGLTKSAGEMALDPALTQDIVAAAAQAFGAACLASAGETAVISLSRIGGKARLAMSFPCAGPGHPAGLAAQLYKAHRGRVSFDLRDGQGFWIADWSAQP